MGKFRKLGGKHENKGRTKRTNKGAKKDKIHGIKKGSKGEAAAYMTRAQALRKLQLSLADFRRLCILKGIYPRDPKKKPAGNDKTYYHVKDIKFLQHEPLMQKFWDLKTFMKKYTRFVHKEDMDSASRLEEQKPEYTLQHLIRERYPSFTDSLRDLDDCLSMLSLFDALPVSHKLKIPGEVIQESTKLVHEFLLFVVKARCLKSVFASIKGYYFQAEIYGERVTWLTPHKFTQELPVEVDFKVLSTFNEFYRTMGKFINFKLYKQEGYAYPPTLNYKKAAPEHMARLSLALEEGKNGAKKSNASVAEVATQSEKQKVEASVIEDFAAVSEEVQQMAAKSTNAAATSSSIPVSVEQSVGRGGQVFAGLKIFVQREVPFHAIYFVLKCGGAQVGWALPGSPFKEGASDITHQVVDRPSDQFEKRANREYVQPQWVLDSFNIGKCLPIYLYAPDAVCPPHLSPFVDDAEEGYVPKQRELLNKLAEEGDKSSTQDVDATTAKTGVTAEQREMEDVEAKYLREVAAESKGVWASDYSSGKKTSEEEEAEDDAGSDEEEEVDEGESSASEEEKKDAKLTKAQRDAADELERRKAMMPKKHKRLYQKIEHSEQVKQNAVSTLEKKRRALEKTEATKSKKKVKKV